MEKARFDAWKASGLSAAAWCRKQDVSKHQMYHWIRNFESVDTGGQETDTQWLRILSRHTKERRSQPCPLPRL